VVFVAFHQTSLAVSRDQSSKWN